MPLPQLWNPLLLGTGGLHPDHVNMRVRVCTHKHTHISSTYQYWVYVHTCTCDMYTTHTDYMETNPTLLDVSQMELLK
jgi:hypothetical protein